MKIKITKSWRETENFECLLFFAQKCNEMFSEYAPNIYKPPVLTTLHLCKEAIFLIDDIEDGLIDKSNIIHILKGYQ